MKRSTTLVALAGLLLFAGPTAHAQLPEPTTEPQPVPAPAPAPPGPAPAPAPEPLKAPVAQEPIVPMDDAALAGLVSESEPSNTEGSSPIDIYGFMDFGYLYPLYKKGSAFEVSGSKKHNFSQGNLNLYLAKKVTQRCRTLMEIRFMYEPNGATDASGTKYINTTVNDHADFNRPLRWGAIEIERAYGECDLVPGLSVRIGQWLTPYGIWNVDHGTPTLIALRRPFVIGDELFPERQTGVQLFGTRNLGQFRLGYSFSVSNGRGPIEAYHDLDDNKAIGARLELQWATAVETTVGGSYYRGRYTSSDPANLGDTKLTINEQYDEQSFGADLQVNWKGLAVRAEAIKNERAYTDIGRPVTSAGLLQADGSRYGYYGLLGYRTPWLGIMPYVLYMEIHPIDTPAALFPLRFWGFHGGLNILLSPYLVLKVEYMQSGIIDPPPGIPALKEIMRNIDTQLAWAF